MCLSRPTWEGMGTPLCPSHHTVPYGMGWRLPCVRPITLFHMGWSLVSIPSHCSIWDGMETPLCPSRHTVPYGMGWGLPCVHPVTLFHMGWDGDSLVSVPSHCSIWDGMETPLCPSRHTVPYGMGWILPCVQSLGQSIPSHVGLWVGTNIWESLGHDSPSHPIWNSVTGWTQGSLHPIPYGTV